MIWSAQRKFLQLLSHVVAGAKLITAEGCCCSFAGDVSLPTAELPAELRSLDWISLFSVAVRKQKHSAGVSDVIGAHF